MESLKELPLAWQSSRRTIKITHHQSHPNYLAVAWLQVKKLHFQFYGYSWSPEFYWRTSCIAEDLWWSHARCGRSLGSDDDDLKNNKIYHKGKIKSSSSYQQNRSTNRRNENSTRRRLPEAQAYSRRDQWRFR
jgi:hypothetical protein